MFTNIYYILVWISKHWYHTIPSEEADLLISQWISQVQRWIVNNGTLYTIKRIKLIRLTVTRFMCSQPLMVNDYMVGVDKDGYPKCINFLKAYTLSNDPQRMRFVLTLLGISRSFPCPVGPDYSSIIKPFTGKFKKIDNEFIKAFVKDFVSHFNPLLDRPDRSKSFLTLKSGPFSGPAILSATVAAKYFTGANLWGLAAIGGDSFMQWVKELKFSVVGSIDKKSQNFIKKVERNGARFGNRKFLHIYDPEAKHRIVACFDYLSQLALNPLSEFLFEVLRGLPQDRTFTQDPVIRNKKEGMNFHSFDLSNATDRFPIELQVQLLTEIAGPYFASAWKNLMVNEPFYAEDPARIDQYVSIKYNVGQPMGARSSWPAFTLSHHMMVQYAAHLEGLYPFSEYILLGDDIVIYHDAVAQRYLDLIQGLGVEISPTKSHVSSDTYEFAKRWFRNGIEISPVPIQGFLENCSNPKLLYAQVLDMYAKGQGPRTTINSVDVTIDLLRHLRCHILTTETNGFYEFVKGHYRTGMFNRRQFPESQLRYFRRIFDELLLVQRNLKEFDCERTRAFLGYHSRHNEYILPPVAATLNQEWIRTTSGVVSGMAMSVIKRLSLFYKKFESNYVQIATVHGLSVKPESFAIHPLTWAIYNSVYHYHQMNKAMGYTTDLNRQLETITLIDIDKLMTRERTAKELIFTYSTLGRKLGRFIQDDPHMYIAKARSMQFGRSLFDIQLAIERAYPVFRLERMKWMSRRSYPTVKVKVD